MTEQNNRESFDKVIRYKFRSSKDWYSLASEDTWENIRYLIEQKHHMHGASSRNKPNKEKAYIKGFYVDNRDNETDPIQDDDILELGTRIVVIRAPLPLDYKPFVPPKYRKDNEQPTKISPDMTEDEKIRVVVGQAGEYIKKHPQRSHKFENHQSAKRHYTNAHPTGMIRPNYVCRYCGAKASHYFRQCPKRNDDNFRPLYKRKLPTGVPMSYFRRAQTEEERERAYITENGIFLVYK
jgi:hypothetical protein